MSGADAGCRFTLSERQPRLLFGFGSKVLALTVAQFVKLCGGFSTLTSTPTFAELSAASDLSVHVAVRVVVA